MLIPPGFCQANFHMPVATWPYVPQCTFGFDTTEYTGTTTEFAEQLYDTWVERMMSQCTSDATLALVRVKYGPNATGPVEEFAGTATGPNSGPSTGPTECLLVTKNTSLGGRQGRGRVYLPAGRASMLSPSGLWHPDAVTALQTQVDLFLSDLETAGIPPVLLHGVGTSDTTPEPVVSLSVQQRSATQRRRNRR